MLIAFGGYFRHKLAESTLAPIVTGFTKMSFAGLRVLNIVSLRSPGLVVMGDES